MPSLQEPELQNIVHVCKLAQYFLILFKLELCIGYCHAQD